MSALRGVLKTCWRLQLMNTDDYMRAVDVPGIKGSGLDQAAGRMLSSGELVALLGSCRVDPSPAGCRDAAVLGLAAYAGLRRHEVAGLVKSVFEKTEGVVDVDWYVESPRTKLRLEVDDEKAAAAGVSAARLVSVVRLAGSGMSAAYGSLSVR